MTRIAYQRGEEKKRKREGDCRGVKRVGRKKKKKNNYILSGEKQSKLNCPVTLQYGFSLSETNRCKRRGKLRRKEKYGMLITHSLAYIYSYQSIASPFLPSRPNQQSDRIHLFQKNRDIHLFIFLYLGHRTDAEEIALSLVYR